MTCQRRPSAFCSASFSSLSRRSRLCSSLSMAFSNAVRFTKVVMTSSPPSSYVFLFLVSRLPGLGLSVNRRDQQPATAGCWHASPAYAGKVLIPILPRLEPLCQGLPLNLPGPLQLHQYEASVVQCVMLSFMRLARHQANAEPFHLLGHVVASLRDAHRHLDERPEEVAQGDLVMRRPPCPRPWAGGLAEEVQDPRPHLRLADDPIIAVIVIPRPTLAVLLDGEVASDVRVQPVVLHHPIHVHVSVDEVQLPTVTR